MIAMWLFAPCLAQVAPQIPEVSSDLFRPAAGSGPFLVTESATIQPGAVATAAFVFADELVQVEVDGESERLLGDVFGVHLAARYGIGPLQLGFDAPAYVTSKIDGRRTALGDPSLMAKLGFGGNAWGLGGIARLGIPLGGAARGLGYPGLHGELGAMGEVRVSRVTVAANGGLRFVPKQEVGVTLDDVAWVRGGVAVEITPWLAPALEVASQGTLSGEADGLGTPVEAIAGLSFRCAPGTIQLGVGRGLTGAVGSPRWRAVLGLTWAEPAPGDTRRRWSCQTKKPSTT